MMHGTYIKIVGSICGALKKRKKKFLTTVGKSSFTDKRIVTFWVSLQQLRKSDPSQGYIEVADWTGMLTHIPQTSHRHGRGSSNLQNEIIYKLSVYTY